MRRIVFVLILGACSHSAASAPAWPKTADKETDGGESLAPHESKQVTVAVEKSDVDKPADKPAADKPAADKPATTGGDAPAAPAAAAPTEDILQAEDIVIEIDD